MYDRRNDNMMLLRLKNNFLKYVIYMSCVFLLLFVIVNVSNIKETGENEEITTSYITYTDELTEVNVTYPRFKDDKITKIITDNIYSYVKDFRSYDKLNKTLDIKYDLYYFDNYVNVIFYIENTLTIIKNRNILIDLKDKKTCVYI